MPAVSAALLALLALPQPQRLAAEVEDAYAIEINPAGLGLTRGSELRLLYGYDGLGSDAAGQVEANGLGVFGALRVFDTFTLGASWTRDWTDGAERGVSRLGAGWGGGPLAFGVAYRRDDPFGPADDLDAWDLGLSLRPFDWLAGGVRVQDVGESQSRRGWDLSLAVRPGWDRLLVSAQWGLREGEALSSDSLDLEGRVEVEALPGLRVGVGLNQDADVFAQLGLDFGRFSVGGFAHSVSSQAQAGGELVLRSVPANRLVVLGKVGVLELSGSLVPEPELDLFRQKMRVSPYGGVPRLIRALARAEGVNGLFVRIGPLSIGWGKAEELRRAIVAVEDAGRRVDCHLFGGGDLTYYVASACTAISVSPPALLKIDGLASTSLYLGEALGRIGVEVEVERIGPYKNAPDQLTRGDMSAEERERLGRYLDVVAEEAIGKIAEGRELTEAGVRGLIDRAVLTATGAEAAGLVDAVLYPDQLEARLAEVYGHRPRLARAEGLIEPPAPRPWTRPDAVAVIHVDAPITSGRSSASPLGLGRSVGARDLLAAMERAERDRRIVAVVLRVDSPGGDAVASDLVARAVSKLAEVKPVVASFGDVAASGGYYVAAPAARIFAEATTLTGSIGIFSLDLDLSGLLVRFGVGVEVLKRGALAGQEDPFTGRSPAGDAAVRRALTASYHRFLDVVAEGRGRTRADIAAVAEGRVWAGSDAIEAGLVDELGGLREALVHAARSAGRDPAELEVVSLPEPFQRAGDPIIDLISVFAAAPPASPAWLGQLLGGLGPQLDSRLALFGSRAPLALLPFVLEVE